MKKVYYVFLKSYNERNNTDIHYAKSDESIFLKCFDNEQDALNYIDELNEKYKNDKEYHNQFYIPKVSYLDHVSN